MKSLTSCQNSDRGVCAESKNTFSDIFGASNRKLWTYKSRNGYLKYGVEPSRFLQKTKMLDDKPCKTKNPNYGLTPAAPEGKCKLYGRISLLANQLKEGLHWKAQDGYANLLSDPSSCENRCMSV